jgi:hypothetical protein
MPDDGRLPVRPPPSTAGFQLVHMLLPQGQRPDAHCALLPSGTRLHRCGGGAMKFKGRLWWYLHILEAIGGKTYDTANPREWLHAFSGEMEKRDPDTINQAHAMGLTNWSHNSDTDTSIIWLTDAGKAWLAKRKEP